MIGATISHYKITAEIGKGGMGIVYKAEDTRLKRTVALKFLSSQTLGDEDHKARFLREAQAAALLDHPNIATVHDIGEEDGHTFMAIAFVDGPELSDKIKERPLKLDEALDIAIQICDGLKEAHEQGVTHRDIKPSNIMLTRKGRVKITDFGLAHLAGRSKLTKSGTSLGTPAYMSPEQALSEPTDRRSDIWAVGVVLYEMLAGHAPFDSDYEQAMVYSIINEAHEPLTAVRTGLPTELDRVVGKALAKRPEERYQHIDDFLVDLRRLKKGLRSTTSRTVATTPTGVPSPVSEASEPALVMRPQSAEPSRNEVEALTEQLAAQSRKQAVAFGIAALCALLALVFAFFPLLQTEPVASARLRRFTLITPTAPVNPSISPDGRHVAYLSGPPRGREVWVQDLDEEHPRVILTSGNFDIRDNRLSWSPDSQFIGFRGGSIVKKIGVSGGPAVTLAESSGVTNGLAWTPDGNSVIFPSMGKLFKVSARGGQAELWLEVQQEGFTASGPAFFSGKEGSEKLLYTEGRSSSDAQVVALDRTSGNREVLAKGFSPVYDPSGHVLYESAAPPGLWAVPFSVDTMTRTGDPFLVSEKGQALSTSLDGTMVYLQGPASPELDRLVWVDRDGNEIGTIGQPQERIRYPALSPDENRVAVWGLENERNDIWIHDVDRAVKTRLTTSGFNVWPTWSPAGDRVAFSSSRSGNRDICVKPADGSGQASPLLLTDKTVEYLTDWSRDEKTLLAFRRLRATGNRGIGDMLQLRRQQDGSYDDLPFLETEFEENVAQFSPDERYVAYVSNESGEREVYIQAFPQGGSKRRVSVNGGSQPRWRADGKELFYVEGESLMSVAVSTSPTLYVGSAEELFSAPGLRYSAGNLLGYDVTPQGDRFVIWEHVEADPDAAPVIRVVQNWYEEFRDREQD